MYQVYKIDKEAIIVSARKRSTITGCLIFHKRSKRLRDCLKIHKPLDMSLFLPKIFIESIPFFIQDRAEVYMRQL